MPDPTGELMAAPTTSRCPSCAATLRAGAPWCTLCYADLRPPAPEPEPAPTPVAYAVDPLTAPLHVLGLPEPATEPTWPCTSCGAANPLILMSCAGCGAGFLSGLREAEGPLLELPVVGDLGAMSRVQRLGLAAGVVGAVLVLVLLLGLLFG